MKPLDVLVVGSGVAGLSAVVRLAETPSLRVGVLTKAELEQSATRWAQGGVAAVIGGDEDSIDLHLADTLAAGAGLCDIEAVRVLVGEGPLRVSELIALGAVFDKEAGGRLARAREGGHSTARVLHAGGAATGEEVERALVRAVRASAAAVMERWFALDLLVDAGECTGVIAVDPHGNVAEVHAKEVVLATGGAGQVYSVTTNPTEATGDGIAMALRADVPVADVEFMQFHPTALHHPAMPRPLLSEALRGHGALLRDTNGERFVDELASRDVVSRAMDTTMRAQLASHLWLDATGLANFDERFPTLAASLGQVGLDPSTDWLPIAPAAHYLSGGVVTDLNGATAMGGLWAAGEVACTAVHGANRLASNSLLEGMVFGARLCDALLAGQRGPTESGAMRGVLRRGSESEGIRCVAAEDLPDAPWEDSPWEDPEDPRRGDPRASQEDPAKLRVYLQRAMTEGAGVLRSAESLHRCAGQVAQIGGASSRFAPSHPGGELANLVELSSAMLRSAYRRAETRGAHARSDFPDTDERWRCRIVHGQVDAQRQVEVHRSETGPDVR